MSVFQLKTKLKPRGDQPQAIRKLVEGLRKGLREQVLLGVTGSGKTFTMAHVIEQLEKPTLIISHNKTLAAQLYAELRDLFPDSAVEYFVSYYDYYQPEAYVPATDTYIEKDASINDDLDRLRLSATGAILTRPDVIVVASVSAIYNLGSPEDWAGMLVETHVGDSISRDAFLKKVVQIQYERRDEAFGRGAFRARGNTVEIFPAYSANPVRVEFYGGVSAIELLDPASFACVRKLERLALYPAKHFVTPTERLTAAVASIEKELAERVSQLLLAGEDLKAKRLESRTHYDLSMLREVGYCAGIENYARHLAGRPPGSRPFTLLDYFRGEFLTLLDESHQTVPQLRGMYNGDRSRKETLVEYGFRLPSALDNRPLKFEEFTKLVGQVVYVSATPGPYEMQRAQAVAEQIIRPTGLMDPAVEVRATEGQIDDLLKEIQVRAKKKERVLVTTLTKRMSEDLARYLKEMGTRVRYLHSEIDAIERVEILRDLRLGKFDCLVGINLLREGLDLPEVSLVVVLDADKEGFLRSDVSLIQTAGRAARHVDGRVILYADTITGAIQTTLAETERRRKLQAEFNRKHGITPRGIQKAVREGLAAWRSTETFVHEVVGEKEGAYDLKTYAASLVEEMTRAAKLLDFERAARLRDKIRAIERELGAGGAILPAAGKTR